MDSIRNHILIIFIIISFNTKASPPQTRTDSTKSVILKNFNNLNKESLGFNAYKSAINGYNLYRSIGKITCDTIAIIDYDLPSTCKRLFILDIINNKIIYSSLVAHGRNSGGNIASEFSNINGSHKSSLGFFKTKETYVGKHGISLRLEGLENGINDNARNRNIVIHKANYVSNRFISKYSRLGRSYGCPALPIKDYDKALKLLSRNILLYIHSSKPL
jgi:hypothetical protein